MTRICPLCQSQVTQKIQHLHGQLFFHCGVCDLIFLPKEAHLSVTAERTRYETHENNPLDLAYQNFMQKFSNPVLEFLQKKQIKVGTALDYGSGVGSPLAALFAEKNIEVQEYDPFFKNFPHLLEEKYDLLLATEVIEHFRHPVDELKKMQALLKPNGIMALMTQFHLGPTAFASWWYARDPTHVSFYSAQTFRWWAAKQNLTIHYLQNPVVILAV